MKLEDQYCLLSQSKRLKELGIDQNTQWYWCYPVIESMISTRIELIHESVAYDYLRDNDGDEFDHAIASAYSVAELGMMLPGSLSLNDGHNWSFYHRHCWKGESVGYSAYRVPSIEQDWYKTEAEARADMVIRLLEGTLMTAEECNKRLTDK